jgi:hypothetical protein
MRLGTRTTTVIRPALAISLIGLAGCAGPEPIPVESPDSADTLELPASALTIERAWTPPRKIGPDADFALFEDQAPIVAEGQKNFRKAVVADLEGYLRTSPTRIGEAMLIIRKAETRGEWTGSYPDDDDEPRTQQEEDIDWAMDMVLAVTNPVRGERFTGKINGELLIRREGEVAVEEPFYIEARVEHPVRDRADLGDALTKVAGRASQQLRARLREIVGE